MSVTHTWREVHSDLEAGRFLGTYGGENTAFHGLAGLRAGVNMQKFHSQRSSSEKLVPALDRLLHDEKVQQCWSSIATLDPLGMFATRPTISATEARMTIPEFTQSVNQSNNQAINQTIQQQAFHIEPDAELDPTVNLSSYLATHQSNTQHQSNNQVVVNNDLTINCVKMAVDLVWNLPLIAHKLKMDEKDVRRVLAESTGNQSLIDPANQSINTYLPPVGGCTVYFFGDINKLSDPKTEVAVRVHDACCGSDVFGTDICTCRPYLIFALAQCVQVAQRGGVGIIAYFRKEGRSLGEVTKFRVYNARKGQEGGDRAENYFKQTENIAGIRDARFQEMMPDVLLMLGIKRIDWLLSMSSDKYDAIVGAGIDVMQRVPLPDAYVPEAAQVEITAKIASGYHSEGIDKTSTLNQLRSLQSIRERCKKVFDLSVAKKSKHFRLDLSKIPDVVDFVEQVTNTNYPKGYRTIPYHSRWRHFNQSDLDALVGSWRCDEVEKARRLIDLVTISVLMDAGAGPDWHYMDSHGTVQSRSEGLAIATFDMFRDGLFSSDPAQPYRVNSFGLSAMTMKEFKKGLQLGDTNRITGLEGRFVLLKEVGKALEKFPEFFGEEVPRPGHIVDYMLKYAKHTSNQANQTIEVPLSHLWRAVIEGFESIWPAHLSGVRRGDVWSYSLLKRVGEAGSDLVPFHKLSQWLTYSLFEPLESLGVKITGVEAMTALAEYRNGGLFVDMGVIVPVDPAIINQANGQSQLMTFDAGSELVVEWRALTICCVDLVWDAMRDKLKVTKEQFPLACLLQGGTWAAGRQIAAQKRKDRTSPILVRSDGTVF